MKHRGFTLLELMVVIAITSLLVGLLSFALQGLTRSTNQTTGRLEAEREARAALEFLERDLSAAVSRQDGFGLPTLVDDPDLPGTQWLTFLSSPMDHSPREPGDVCLISYRVGMAQPEEDGAAFPALYRLRLDSASTFEEVLGSESSVDRTAIEDDSVLSDHWLASGVLSLQIKALIDGEVIEIGDTSEEDSTSWEGIEVTLEVLTSTGRMQYGTLPLAELRERYGHRFTRRIRLHPTSR